MARAPDPAAVHVMAALLNLQLRLLSDGKRNRGFQRALSRRVRRGSRVLDLGAGSGVWAIAAARLGASRVVAVEREPLLIPVIEALARDNGVADRVEAVCADALRLELRERFDVIVCEMIGERAFDSGVVPIVKRARRWLARGGTLIPQTVSLLAAPGRLSPPPHKQARGTPVRAERLYLLGSHLAFPLRPPVSFQLLAPPVRLVSAELRGARKTPRLSDVSASWRLKDASRVTAIAVWSHCRLAPGIQLSGMGTLWAPTLLSVGPFAPGSGRLDWNADLSGVDWSWRVVLQGRAGVSSRAYASHMILAALGRRRDSGAR